MTSAIPRLPCCSTSARKSVHEVTTECFVSRSILTFESTVISTCYTSLTVTISYVSETPTTPNANDYNVATISRLTRYQTACGLHDKTGHSNIDYGPLKTAFSISSFIAAGVWSAVVSTNAQVNVTQYHNHSSRDGLYVDSAFTPSAAANLTRDLNFDGTIVGN